MRRAITFGLSGILATVLATGLASCTKNDGPVQSEAPVARAPTGDPYSPARPGAIAEWPSRPVDDAGTEDEPAPALDRPYVHLVDTVEGARSAVRSAPNSRGRREALATAYSDAGRYDLARREIGVLLTATPDDAALHFRYARETWYERGAIDETLFHLRAARALKTPPALLGELFFLLGAVAEAKDDPKRAARFYGNVVKRDPSHAEALYRLGVLARDGGDEDDAFNRFRSALNVDDRHTSAMFALGRLMLKRGSPAEGERLLALHARMRQLEALGYLDESEAFQCVVLGNHAALAGDFETALSEFERALADEPNHLDARSYRAATLMDLERNPEAIGELELVLQKNAAHVHALTTLAGYHLGAAKPSDDPPRAPSRAVVLASRAVTATSEKDARALALLARSQLRAGRRPEALAAVRKAIALEPDRGAFRALERQIEKN